MRITRKAVTDKGFVNLKRHCHEIACVSLNFKMASTSDGGHSGKRINSGRKRTVKKYRDGKGYLKDI